MSNRKRTWSVKSKHSIRVIRNGRVVKLTKNTLTVSTCPQASTSVSTCPQGKAQPEPEAELQLGQRSGITVDSTCSMPSVTSPFPDSSNSQWSAQHRESHQLANDNHNSIGNGTELTSASSTSTYCNVSSTASGAYQFPHEICVLSCVCTFDRGANPCVFTVCEGINHYVQLHYDYSCCQMNLILYLLKATRFSISASYYY
jgi:RNase P/RNase MRP subunit p29